MAVKPNTNKKSVATRAPKKDKHPAMPTGKGVFEYPWLCEPDFKFDADGVYKCSVVVSLDDPDAIALRDYIDNINTGSHYPYEIDEDNNTITFKSKAKADYPPKIYDSKNNRLDPTKVSIWGGTTGRLSVRPNAYTEMKGGVNLYLCAAQVIDLVAGSESPFGTEDDGFVGGVVDDCEPDSGDDDLPVDNTGSTDGDF